MDKGWYVGSGRVDVLCPAAAALAEAWYAPDVEKLGTRLVLTKGRLAEAGFITAL